MSKLDACFMSEKDNWETPDDLFADLDMEFMFDVDAAASPQNAKVPNFYCEDHWYHSQPLTDGVKNAFKKPEGYCNTWHVWCNPPYGPAIPEWLKAATLGAGLTNTTSVFLLPSRTDTKWWHEWVWDRSRNRPQPGVEVRFLKGRLKFKGAPSNAPFPSVIVIIRGTNK